MVSGIKYTSLLENGKAALINCVNGSTRTVYTMAVRNAISLIGVRGDA
jgi:hypothetical protein